MQKTILYLLLTVLLLTGCAEEQKTYKIGVSQCAAGRWRNKVNQEMLAAQHLYECHAKVSICDAQDDPQRQIRQIDSLSASGIDLLVVAPTESAPIAEAVARTRKRGIPVIFFDRTAQTDDYTAFIGGDNVEAGLTMGRHAVALAKKLRAESGRQVRIMEVTGNMNSSPAQQRHKGFMQALQGCSDITYTSDTGNWLASQAREAMDKQIAQGAAPDIVFCHNDGMCVGISESARQHHIAEHVSILGIDGMPDEGIAYVQQGQQAGTYVYPTHGQQIVRLALDILKGQHYKRYNRLSGMLVTPDNADLIALNSKELIRQNTDLITIQDKLEEYFGLYRSQRRILVGSLVAIVMLILAVIIISRAFIQTRRLIRQRQAMHEEQTLFYTNPDGRTLRQVFETPAEQLPTPRSQDTIFAETLNEAIRRNLSNPNLKMDELGESVGLSRVQLYRKVKSITGLTPVELLRQMRLQQGYVLLTSTTKTVQEIAYEVGFGTPSYFSKCFKQQYGKYPMDLRT